MASPAPSPATVLVTGASGLLGRAVLAAFARDARFRAVGAAFSRAEPPLLRCDLRDAAASRALVQAQRPAVVVHAAAERRPDACEKDAAGSALLNVHATFHLAAAAAEVGARFVYVSTDYLFDGTAAPYAESAPTSPLNEYGRLKLRGEHAALAAHPRPLILRVPVLFGPTGDLNESAVTTFAAAARDAGRPQRIDDWQIRVPTYTPDIGRTLVNIARRMLDDAGAGAAPLPTLLNYSSNERWTRYGFVQFFGKLLGVPTAHFARLVGEPPGAKRPYDCKLDTALIESLGLAAPSTPFEDACREVLGLPPRA